MGIVRAHSIRGVRGLFGAAAALLLAAVAGADTVRLKDGSTLDGVVIRETDTFVQIRVKIGAMESVRTVQKSEIASIQKDAPSSSAPAAPAKDAAKPAGAGAGDSKDQPPAQAKPATEPSEKAAARARQLDGAATRVAILNFGPPESWNGQIEGTIGKQVNASAWREAVPLLEKDKVQVVVVRIHSPGGAMAEIPRFHEVFQNVYKRKFRTVGWVESGISAAAMSSWVLEEFYFMPNGSLGACTAWYGPLKAVEGAQLQVYLDWLEKASAKAGRSPAIMRAMQVQDPLSATIDEKTGEVTWFQDTGGQYLVNPPGQIYTMKVDDAMKFKFARGVAATKEELARAMGLNEVVWAGEEAARFIDQNMRDSDKMEKRWELYYREFQMYFGLAQQSQDEKQRGAFVGKALTALREVRQLFKANPNFADGMGITNEWFDQREEELKKLLKKDK